MRILPAAMMLVTGVNLVGVSAGARVASLFAVAKLLTPTNTATRAVTCPALALEALVYRARRRGISIAFAH